MEWSLGWWELITVYLVEFLPYIAVFILAIFTIRDITKRKLSRSTVIVALIAFAIVALSLFLSRVI